MVHWARKVMNERTAEWVAGLNPAQCDALEISGTYWSGLNWRSYRASSYPDYDVCAGLLSDARFDVILCEQVLEHLPYPYRAVRNIRAMLRPYGHFLVTTPFLIKIHHGPLDCTRWTPEGMGYFLEECGFDRENIKVEGWGNYDCVTTNFRSFVDYKSAQHSLENDPEMPISVWAMARK